MSAVRMVALPVSTNAAGAGTATTPYPLSGLITEIRMPLAGTAITLQGGTTDFTFTRAVDGGTILNYANQSAPWVAWPSRSLSTTAGGTTSYATGIGPVVQGGVPIDGYLTCTIAQGQFSAAGTVYIYVDGR